MMTEKRLISKKEILEIAIMLNNFGFKREELKSNKDVFKSVKILSDYANENLI